MLIIAGKLLLWISFTFIYIVQNITHAQPDFNSYACVVESGNFTINSTYEVNLNYTLKAISDINSDQGFYSITSGYGQGRVNSVALCRGDVDPDVCRSCLNDSIVKLRQLCPNQKEAVGYYDNCLLKYSNETILENTGIRFYVFMANTQNASDQDGFSRALRPLMTRLRGDAAAGNGQLKFATGNTTGPDSTTIYGLVQCTPDLNELQCSRCLEDIVNQFGNFYGGATIGGRTLLPMCNFRYEIYPFYNGSTLVIPPPPSSSPPPLFKATPSIPPPPPPGQDKTE